MNSTPFGLKLIFGVFCVVLLVANSVEAVKQGEDLMTILARERKATLEIVQRENQRLRQEDKQLREDLRQKDEQQRAQLDKLHSKLDKLHERNEKREARNEKLQKEIARIQHRQADSEIQHSLRQRDENETSALLTQLKKIVKSEIKEYLINEKVCVGGTIESFTPGSSSSKKTVQFGYEFVRKPTVLASISHLDFEGRAGAYIWVKSISKSSAVISANTGPSANCYVAWLACL